MIRGIKKIGFGTPGDGVAGQVTKEYEAFKVSSMTLKDKKFTTENIPAENNSAYITISGDAEPNTITGEIYDVPLADLPMLTGGSFDSGTGEYSTPVTAPDIYLTVVVTSVETKGQSVEVTYPYAKVIAWREGTLTENELVTLRFEATANVPVATDGTKGKETITKVLTA